ncbi:hypothetical protein [Fontivita pretiosa]|uniref:hypothetical protein n=1 Tax=Fontivita pretiosa TaxID=2989684 RepID=UPI003D17F193
MSILRGQQLIGSRLTPHAFGQQPPHGLGLLGLAQRQRGDQLQRLAKVAIEVRIRLALVVAYRCGFAVRFAGVGRLTPSAFGERLNLL